MSVSDWALVLCDLEVDRRLGWTDLQNDILILFSTPPFSWNDVVWCGVCGMAPCDTDGHCASQVESASVEIRME